jgi:hypothetical protein
MTHFVGTVLNLNFIGHYVNWDGLATPAKIQRRNMKVDHMTHIVFILELEYCNISYVVEL